MRLRVQIPSGGLFWFKKNDQAMSAYPDDPNLFDYFESIPSPVGGYPPWTARAPGSPNESFDLILVPSSPKWEDDPDSAVARAQIEAEPWVDPVVHPRGTARLCLSDNWIET